MQRVKYISKYTVVFPEYWQLVAGEWVEDFSHAEDSVLVAAGFDKWFDPDSLQPLPDNFNRYRSTYVLTNDIVTYGDWERVYAEPSIEESMMKMYVATGKTGIFTIQQLYTHAAAMEDWNPNTLYQQFAVVQDEGSLYIALNTLQDLSQNVKPSLPTSRTVWGILPDKRQEWCQWVQPISTIVVWNYGDQCWHGNYRYISRFDGLNTWEPGLQGTEALWENVGTWPIGSIPPGSLENPYIWENGTLYEANVYVIHNGFIWLSKVPNNHWEPADSLPTIWEKIGPAE